MNRFLTAGLASAALITAFVLASPPVHAQDAPAIPESGTLCCACNAPADSQTTCLTVDRVDFGNRECPQLPTFTGDTLKGWSCTKTLGPANEGGCRPVAANGQCQKGVMAASAAGSQSAPPSSAVTERSNKTDMAIIPILNTPIPRFAFNTGDPNNTSSLLAQYIAGAYGWLISIAAIAATVMFVWGAFRYMLGSSGMISAARGKEIMQEAVIGMLLVLGASTILRTVNPDTLTLDALYIQGVNPFLVGNYRTDAIPSEGILSQTAVQGTAKPADAEQQIIAGVKLVPGVDPCAILAICQTESGLRPLWSGQLSGGAAEKAHAWGPCQQATQYLTAANPWVAMARTYFPDFPAPVVRDTPSERIRMGNYLNTHYAAAGFIAALNFRSNVADAGRNELLATAAYYGGDASLKKWRQANGCVPGAGITLKNPGAGPAASCIPEFVAVISAGESPKGCPEDKYVCPNAKQDNTAQFVGQCSNPPRRCYAAKTGSYVRSVLNKYSGFAARFDCKAGDGTARPPASGFTSSGTANRFGLTSGDKILVVGDSLAVGLTGPLQTNAKAGGYTVFGGPAVVGSFVEQWASGGTYNSTLTAGLAQRPKLVIVSLGVNDDYSDKTQSVVDGDVNNAKKIIQQITDAGAKYLWLGPLTPLKRAYGNDPGNMVIPALKSAIPSANYYAAPAGITQSSDNLHPTSSGYKTWADAIWAQIQ
jgi:lysophospholipase L1-like esterase